MSKSEREAFHSTIAKCLFVANRSRPIILPTISVLAGRLRCSNRSDWGKGKRLVNYLNSTRKLHLTLRCDVIAIANWFIDALFAVHEDFKSQSIGVLLMAKCGGGIASSSTQKKLNLRSFAEAELIAADNFLAKILWVRLFLEA